MRSTSAKDRRVARLAAAIVALTGCAIDRMAGEPGDPDREPGESEQKTAGHRLFERHCAECHGSEGHGIEEAPALIGEDALLRFTTAQDVFVFVRREMPFDAPASLKPAYYWAILAFILDADHVEVPGRLGPDNAPAVRLRSG